MTYRTICLTIPHGVECEGETALLVAIADSTSLNLAWSPGHNSYVSRSLAQFTFQSERLVKILPKSTCDMVNHTEQEQS
jgi:hypothetical protein